MFIMDSDHCLVETTKEFLNNAFKQQCELENKIENLNVKNKIKKIKNNIQIENKFQGKPLKKILVECEVFAESFDKDNLTIKTPTLNLINKETNNQLLNNLINTNQSLNLNQTKDTKKKIISKDKYLKKNLNKKINEKSEKEEEEEEDESEEEESEVKFNKKKRKFIFKIKNNSSDDCLKYNQINNIKNEKKLCKLKQVNFIKNFFI